VKPSSRAKLNVPRRQLLVAGSIGVAGLLAGRLTGPSLSAQADPPVDRPGDAGKLYHDRSKLSIPGWVTGVVPGWHQASSGSGRAATVPLPTDFSDRGLALEEAIERRRSGREYSALPVSLLELSRLLHRASGITDRATGFRAAPSAGALYPLETYVVANGVEDLPRGIYRYRPAGHSLEAVREGDFSRQVSLAALGQEMVARAPVVLLLSAVFERCRVKYRERSYRYILMECGHVAQNVYLAATSMGLSACAVAAFLDDDLNGLLGLDGEEEAALYLVCVGRPEGQGAQG
jgi:SagB-type dehydrogenase family enzyme